MERQFDDIFLAQGCISGGNFCEDMVSSFYLNLLTDKQANRKDKRRILHNLLAEVITLHISSLVKRRCAIGTELPYGLRGYKHSK